MPCARQLRPRCGGSRIERRGQVTRVFRLLPIGRRPVQLMLDVARVFCPKCEITRQVKVAFADEHRRHARSFERYVLDLSRHTTIQSVAQHLQIGWDTVKEIQKRHLERRTWPRIYHRRLSG